jgi:ribosomal protein S18 acetylase RimI-like enzyme
MQRPSLKIVAMTRSHLPACRRIVARSEPWKTLGEDVDFAPAIAGRQAYVCLRDGQVAGFVVFTPGPVFARGGYLRAIGVAPDMRRNGVGGALLAFAEAATARRARHLYLCASSFNRGAQAFYRKSGYIRVGRILGLIREDAAEIIYWKRLRPRPRGRPTPARSGPRRRS